jgi:hypothetical protein
MEPLQAWRRVGTVFPVLSGPSMLSSSPKRPICGEEFIACLCGRLLRLLRERSQCTYE